MKLGPERFIDDRWRDMVFQMGVRSVSLGITMRNANTPVTRLSSQRTRASRNLTKRLLRFDVLGIRPADASTSAV